MTQTEMRRANQKKWCDAHREELRAYSRKYNQEHREELKEYMRAYRLKKCLGITTKTKKLTQEDIKQQKRLLVMHQNEFRNRMNNIGIDVEYQNNVVIFITSHAVRITDERKIYHQEYNNERMYKQILGKQLIYVTNLTKNNYLHRQLYIKYEEFSEITAINDEIFKKLTDFDIFL